MVLLVRLILVRDVDDKVVVVVIPKKATILYAPAGTTIFKLKS
jgi:hypothetical protein